jgi:SAM-dependent methyltransferase
LPFANASLDGLILQHVVEHLTAVEMTCREFYRILRPEGVLLLMTPNGEFSDLSVFDDPTHVQIFNRRGLCDILASAGFSIVDLRTLGLPWFRAYHTIPSGWRLRRFVTKHAVVLSTVPYWRWGGQTLCCAARRPSP